MNPILLVVSLALLATSATASSKPKVSLYYESLCPYCHQFFLQQLAPAYDALKGHFEVELVPYGNARVVEEAGGKRHLHCQHGEAECYGNRVQGCALRHLDTNTAFGYIRCNFAAANWRDTAHVGESCAKEMHLNWSIIKGCVDGAEGERLMETYRHQTDSLRPRKTGVPWVTINGEHVNVRNLKVDLCEKYLVQANLPACHGH